MNEIKKIHLGRQPFTISVEAHKLLRDYLAAIEERVGSKSDVLKEVEMRMAELLAERGISGEKVILVEDVDFLKEQLGKPHDFSEEDAPDDTTNEPKAGNNTKRLYRDSQTGMIAGVCSGLAAYFGIDTTVVRLIFVAVTLLGGWGILVYIILWLVTPDVSSPSDRLQMQGKAVTVDSIKEIVDRADVKGAADRASKAVGPAIEKLAQVIAAIFGILLVIIGGAIFAAIMATISYLTFHRHDLIADAVAFPVGTTEGVFTASALIVSAVICFMFILSGLSMVRRKSLVPGWIIGVLVGLFIAASAVGTAAAPDTVNGVRARYHAAQHLTMHPVEKFTTVRVNGQDVSYVYEKSDKYEVGVRYIGKTVTKTVKTHVVNDQLTIDASGFKSYCDGFCFNSAEFSEVIIRAPKLDKVITDNGTNTLTGGLPAGSHFNTSEYPYYGNDSDNY